MVGPAGARWAGLRRWRALSCAYSHESSQEHRAQERAMSQQALHVVLIIYLSVLMGCGGAGGSGTGELPRTDATAEATWLMRARLQEARQEVGVAALQEKMYVVGGFRRTGS